MYDDHNSRNDCVAHHDAGIAKTPRKRGFSLDMARAPPGLARQALLRSSAKIFALGMVLVLKKMNKIKKNR